MKIKKWAIERNIKIKLLLLFIGIVVLTGSDLLVKELVEQKLRNIPSEFTSNEFEEYIIKFDTPENTIRSSYEKREDGKYYLVEENPKKLHLLWKELRKFGFDKKVVVIEGVWNFVYETNEDIGFSILRGLDQHTTPTQKWILLVCLQSAGVFVILIYFLFTKEVYQFIPLAIIVTGALGNVMDRIFRGYVVDYVMWSFKFIPHRLFNPWPIFNLADVYTVCGTISLFILLFIFDRKEEKKIKA